MDVCYVYLYVNKFLKIEQQNVLKSQDFIIHFKNLFEARNGKQTTYLLLVNGKSEIIFRKSWNTCIYSLTIKEESNLSM